MTERAPRFVAALLAVLFAAPAAAQSFAGASMPAAAQEGFGTALAVGEGEVLVGEPDNRSRSGIVYVYRKSGGAWTQQATLTAPNPANNDGFGQALALDGTRLLVSQPVDDAPGTIHVFEKTGDAWRHVTQFSAGAADDGFGGSIALAGDAALIGAPGDAEATGAVYVFRRGASGAWTQQAKLTAPDGAAGAAFGSAVSFLGPLALIGAPNANENAGRLYVFGSGQAGWQMAANIAPNGLGPNARFGSALAVADQRLLVGVPGFGAPPQQEGGRGRGGRGGRGGGGGAVGAVFGFEFDAQEGTLEEIGRYHPFAASGGFGSAIAATGSDFWFGTGNTTFVYDIGPDAQMVSARRLTPEGVQPGDRFGATVAARGNLAAVGLTGRFGGDGSVMIFERNTAGNWVAANTLDSEPDEFAPVTGGEVRCSDEGKAHVFDCGAVDIVAYMPVHTIGPRGTGLNDVWGWTDASTGKEYVIVGRRDGTSFVDISDPNNPVYLGNLPRTAGTSPSTWRDMKVYKDHVYIVADGAPGHGVQVFDLTRLRNVPNAPAEFTEDAHYDNVSAVHNIVINEESGFAYAVGARSGGETCGGGLHMIDIREPKNPTFAGCFADPQTGRSGTGYSHDAQCVMYKGPDPDYQGAEICMGANETMLSIADVTDKANPKAVSRVSYPRVGYSHQGWFTEDHRYFYLDDELDEINQEDTDSPLPGTRTLIWDMTDLDDPQFVGEHFGTTKASDHNLYIKGNLMYQSNYQSGLRVLSLRDPSKPVEIGYIDTVPEGDNGPGFGGSWSNYPFFASGVVAVTSGSEGLFLVKVRNPNVVF